MWTLCLRLRLLPSSLTRRAPVRDAGAVALRVRADERAASAAGAARAAIDAVQRSRAADGRGHEPMGGLERCAQFGVRHAGDRAPGRDPRLPQRLRAPYVPDPGDEALVEERVADLPVPLYAHALEHRVVRGLLVEDVRAEARAAAAVELEDGAVPEHRLVLGTAEDEPRPAGAGRPARLDAPAAGHAQMAAQDMAALEAEEQVLARGLDGFEHEPVKPLSQPLGRGARVRRLDVDLLADEHLQSQRRPVERIPLRHGMQPTIWT